MVDGDVEIRRREAAEWFARLNQRRVTGDDVRAFSVWRKSPENLAAYERVEALWRAADSLSGDPDIIAALAQAKEAPTAAPARPRSPGTGIFKPLGALAAIAAVAVCAAVWVSQRPLSYSTGVGEQRSVRLADGSRITLDTASEVAVRLRGDRRSVELVEGRALFEVQSDTARPFVVTAGGAVVTATGTRFDVRRIDEGARVLLIEGRVSVERTAVEGGRWTLDPGQQVATTEAGPRVVQVDVPVATSWVGGRVTFQGSRLADAIAEMNRYSETRIVLRADAVSEIEVNGVFDTDDQGGFVAALFDLYGLTVESQGDDRILLSGGPSGPAEKKS